MVAGLEDVGAWPLGQDGADGNTASETFRDAHHIGMDAHLLAGQEGAGASDAGLHLIGHEKDIPLFAESFRGFEVGRVEGIHAAFTWMGSKIKAQTLSVRTASRAAILFAST